MGELGRGWAYLGTAEREAVALEIAEHFESSGIRSTILLGPGPRVMAEVENGKLASLVPKPNDSSSGERGEPRDSGRAG